jgi:lactate permease
VLPVVTVLVLLGVVRRPAWQAALAGLIVGLIVAVGVWQLPLNLALDSVLNGAVFALWPVMWIVFNALVLYNIAVRSGRFDAFRNWLMVHLPNDRRVVLVVIGFCFGCLLEGICRLRHAGRHHRLAFDPDRLSAARSARVRADLQYRPGRLRRARRADYRAGSGDEPAAATLAAMVGRQLPIIALILPFYVIALYGGMRSVRALWPLLLVAGGSFGICQFLASNYIDYTLTDVLASMGSLAATFILLRFWKPAPDPEFAIRPTALAGVRTRIRRATLAGMAAVDHRFGGGHYLELRQDLSHRAAGHSLAGAAQRHFNHPLQRQAVRGRLDLPAARHGHRDICLRRC